MCCLNLRTAAKQNSYSEKLLEASKHKNKNIRNTNILGNGWDVYCCMLSQGGDDGGDLSYSNELF